MASKNSIGCFPIILVILFITGMSLWNKYKSSNKEEFKIQKTHGTLADLVNRGELRMIVETADIKGIQISIEGQNGHYPHEYHITIPAGTHFISDNDSTQDVVSTELMNLDSDTYMRFYEVPTVCASLHKKAPHKGNNFAIKNDYDNDEIKMVFRYINKKDIAFQYSVIQSVVWIITDNATYDELTGLRIGFDLFTPVIVDIDIAHALSLLKKAGVDISNRNIWKQRMKIYRALSTEEKEKNKFLLNE